MRALQSPTAIISSILGNIQVREEPPQTSPQWSEVVLVAGFSPWQIRTIRRICELLLLPQDWDSYGSPPPTKVAAHRAIQLVTGINPDSFLSPRVIPVPGGGVQLEWSLGEREVEIEIDDDGSVEYLKAERGRPITEGQIALADLAGTHSLLSWLTA